MPLPELLETSSGWLAWGGVVLSALTIVAFLARWGLRFRLVGVTSFTLLLSASCWAFSVSYTPTVKVDGAVRVPVVFDNGDDLVVAQAGEDFPPEAVAPTLEQLAQNVRPGGRSSAVVSVRLRQLQPADEGASKPIVLGELERSFEPG